MDTSRSRSQAGVSIAGERAGDAGAAPAADETAAEPDFDASHEEWLIVNLHPRILLATDRVLAALVVALVLGSALCFGGAVWWFRPAFAAARLPARSDHARPALARRPDARLEEPADPAGASRAGARAACSSSRCPPRSRAGFRRPRTRSIRSGVIPAWRGPIFPSVELDEPAQVRSPATLDRAATLRWLVGAVACLGIFWAVSHFADRLKRLYLVWGCVVAAFLLNAAFGLVQIGGRSRRTVRLPSAGAGPRSGHRRSTTCSSRRRRRSLRRAERSVAAATRAPALEPAAVVPEQPFLFGTMMGRHGALPGVRLAGSAAGPGDRAARALAPRQPREPVVPA